VRFLYPVLVLAYGAFGLPAGWLRHPWAQLSAAGALCVASAATGFPFDAVVDLAGGAIVLALVGLALAWAWGRWPSKRRAFLQYGALALVLGYAAGVYVAWPGHLKECRDFTAWMYERQYGKVGEVWNFVNRELPPDGTIAYANTYLVHPLSGFEHRRRIVYVPTRRAVEHIADLPHLDAPQTGETLVGSVAAAMVAETDGRRWLERLFASGATHLMVFYREVVREPPELEIVRANPMRFEQVFSNEAGVVYRLRK
jgi:hypothetical protein